ncbi:MAG: sulfatase-like hydrolase/transferase, partial [Planctomycetota bacterium]
DNAFFAVLDELDRQIGRLIDTIDELGLAEDTLIIFTSDNGPTDWPSYYEAGHLPPGFTGPLFGRKWSLFEGGIRMPFIARWKGKIPAAATDAESVMAAVDVLPTVASLCGLAGGVEESDGVDMSEALLGRPVDRGKPLFWEYGVYGSIKPGNPDHASPELAVRDGDWKLLCDVDGGAAILFNIRWDVGEQNDLSGVRPAIASRLKSELLTWWGEMNEYYD